MTDEQHPSTSPEAARIAALEAENARLRAALRHLEERIAWLEARLNHPPPDASQSLEPIRTDGATSSRDQVATGGAPVWVGKSHQATSDIEMLVLDYDRGVATVTLPAGSVFQPWRPEDHWRGVKAPITLGDQASEFDWGVTSADGHFLRWDDFFERCELADEGETSSGDQGLDTPARSGGAMRPGQDDARETSPAPAKPAGEVSATDLFSRDARGRTPLFHAAEQGRLDDIETMLARLPGTGFYPQRLGLIEIEDNDGLTAADVAERSGYKEIAELLRYKAWAMINFG